MKRIFNIIMMVLAAALLAACQTDQPDGSQYVEDDWLEVTASDVIFSHNGGTGHIFVEGTTDFLVTSEKPWLEIESVSGNIITLKTGRNESLETRYAIVTIVSGKASATVQTQQFGITSDKIWPTEYDFPYQG